MLCLLLLATAADDPNAVIQLPSTGPVTWSIDHVEFDVEPAPVESLFSDAAFSELTANEIRPPDEIELTGHQSVAPTPRDRPLWQTGAGNSRPVVLPDRARFTPRTQVVAPAEWMIETGFVYSELDDQDDRFRDYLHLENVGAVLTVRRGLTDRVEARISGSLVDSTLTLVDRFLGDVASISETGGGFGGGFKAALSEQDGVLPSTAALAGLEWTSLPSEDVFGGFGILAFEWRFWDTWLIGGSGGIGVDTFQSPTEDGAGAAGLFTGFLEKQFDNNVVFFDWSVNGDQVNAGVGWLCRVGDHSYFDVSVGGTNVDGGNDNGIEFPNFTGGYFTAGFSILFP